MYYPRAIFLADPVFFIEGNPIDYVYSNKAKTRLVDLVNIDRTPLSYRDFCKHRENLKSVEVIFSCWGMPRFTETDFDALPNLKIVFYASGSVSRFAEPFFNRGIKICNAVEANAVPVAEFCLGHIILSCKRTFTINHLCRQGPWNQLQMPVGRGAYGETVGLVGIGAVCRHLLRLLEPYNLRVIAYSDYLDLATANRMGIDELVDVKHAFSEAYVVSNHLPNRPELQQVITEEHFLSMRENATFINTGRGEQIDEAGMINALRQRPDIAAFLDVQKDEPPHASSGLYKLPNVHMTSHIAGSMNDEVHRMADWLIEDCKRWLSGKPLRYEVNPELVHMRA